MLFNSYVFLLLFLPVALVLFQWSIRRGPENAPPLILIALSLGFYAWWGPLYLLLLLASIAINFCIAQLIYRQASVARYWISFGIALNIGLLGYYKYRGFFSQIVNDAAGRQLLPVPEIFLPLAISFYTFQQIAFLADIYRKHLEPPRFIDYAASVSFFPHLIAGPLVQYREIIPQFRALRSRGVCATMAAQGLALFALGLFKKTVIADNCGRLADVVFSGGGGLVVGTGDAWMAAIAFSLQLYFDFSAYSDMALGLACFFGITLPMNFDSPYKSLSISEFWRRWHITLGIFLRDYLYVALGGNRGGKWRTLTNLFVTMLLGGLWHGAGWTFVIWGALHGFFLVVHRIWVGAGRKLPPILAWALTALSVVLAWVVFRADTVTTAATLYKAMFVITRDFSELYRPQDLLKLLLFSSMVLVLPNAVRWVRGEARWKFSANVVQTGAIAMVMCVALLQVGQTRTFLYFNF